MHKKRGIVCLRHLTIRTWSRILVGCASVLGFGAACCDRPMPIYGVLMNTVEETTSLNKATGNPSDALPIQKPQQTGQEDKQ